MRLAWRTVCLLFLLIFIAPLYAQPFSDDEESLLDYWFFFLIELFISDEIFSTNESLMDEENLFAEEDFPDDETLLAEETLSDEETLLAEETLPDEETLLAEEDFPDEEILLAEDDFLYDDDDLFDDFFDDFFFEAPTLIIEAPEFEMRSFDEIFPSFSSVQKIRAMGNQGLRNSFTKDESPTLLPNPDLEIDLMGSVMMRNPSHLIEALVVVPYNERELDLLDIYNALGRIENIKDHPVSVSGNDLYVFTESTRIESSRNRRAIPDPLPADTLPFSETMYLRLREINLGNLFLRGDVSISLYGITYSMTNFTDVSYFIFPLMRAERFLTIIYLEPVKEGMLIYSMSGFYLPGFIADRVNLTPNINRRIEIFVKWITAGLREQENKMAEMAE